MPTIETDNWATTNGTMWPNTSAAHSWTQVLESGNPSIAFDSNDGGLAYGRASCVAITGSGPYRHILQNNVRDVELRVKVNRSLFSTSGGGWAGIILRSTGASAGTTDSYYLCRAIVVNDGKNTFYPLRIAKVKTGTYTDLLAPTSGADIAGLTDTDMWLAARIVQVDATHAQIQAKLWDPAQSEPEWRAAQGVVTVTGSGGYQTCCVASDNDATLADASIGTAYYGLWSYFNATPAVTKYKSLTVLKDAWPFAAAGNGAAAGATGQVSAASIAATGSGTAYDLVAQASPTIGDAVGTGTAYNPSVSTGVTNPWVIDGNQATWDGATGSSAAWIDANEADVDVQASITLGSVDACAGVCFRVQDVSNYLTFYYDHTAGRFHLAKMVGDALTDLDTYDSAQTLGTTHTFKVSAHGSALIGYLDGTPIVDVTDATFLTETRHGLYVDASIDDHSTWDDFTIALSTPAGYAFNPTASTGVFVSAQAEAATGIAIIDAPVITITSVIGDATGTAVADGATTNLSTTSDSATGTGSASGTGGAVIVGVESIDATGVAYQPSVETTGATSVFPSEATATGTAEDASAALGVSGGSGTGTGSAEGTGGTVSVGVDLATATGEAYQPAVQATGVTNVFPTAATGTATTNDPLAAIGASTGDASGTGSASGTNGIVNVGVGTATGTGEANQALASTAENVYAQAEEATATGESYGTGAAITSVITSAAGSGSAADSPVGLGAGAGTGTGTGSASGTGGTVVVGADDATGQGDAYNPTATTEAIANAQAGVATGTGTAADVHATISSTPSTSTATGIAHGLAVLLLTGAGSGAGSGSADGTNGSVGVSSQVALGTGLFYDPLKTVETVIAAALALGLAYNARINPLVTFVIDVCGREPLILVNGEEPQSDVQGCERPIVIIGNEQGG